MPIKKYDNDNDNSLVYYLNINDLRFLLTGDISKKVECDLYREYGAFKVDVLKLAHHGSNTSSDRSFLMNNDPKIAIVSTSGMYNHPSMEVMNLLNKMNVEVFSTKEKGNVKFHFTKIANFITTSKGDFVIIEKK